MDKNKLEKLLNGLLQEVALGGFSNFLEEHDITEEEYDSLSAQLEKDYDIKLKV